MRSRAMSTRLLVAAGLLAGMLAVPGGALALGPDDYSGCAGTVILRERTADPSTYLSVLPTLEAGDLLQLEAGTYPSGLPLSGVSGSEGSCIVIEGPESGPPALFPGRDCCNTVSLSDVSYVVIRRLELDGDGHLGDGVKAESTATSVHHLTLEDLVIRGHGADQQIVGINTKCPAWNWVVRRNVIDGAGTGMYFGDSTGDAEFVHSLVEHNLVVDTIGYNLQIKHQNGRPPGAPPSGTTVVRHNVFSKADGASTGDDARPNVLVGHRPLTGDGSEDDTLVYGNFFWQNGSAAEPLFQGEGHVLLYDNLLVNDAGPGIAVQPHNDVPKRIRIVQNTVVASGTAVRVTGGDPAYQQRVTGNAVFGTLTGGVQTDNVVDVYGAAGSYLTNPDGVLQGMVDRLDLYPLANGALAGPVDTSGFVGYPDGDRDFDGTPRSTSFRGAYAGEGTNPGWLLALERKPEPDTPLFGDGFESGDTSDWSSSVP